MSSDNQNDHPILQIPTTDLTMTFSSKEYSKMYRENRPSKFKQPVIDPFVPTSKTMMGLKYISVSPGYYNVVENDIIEIFTTTNGVDSEYIDSILIEAGYYPTAETLMDVINTRLRNIYLKGKLPVVPRFSFNKEAGNGFDEEGNMTLFPAHYIDNNKHVWVCLELPKKMFTNFGFTEEICNHKNQFGKEEMVSKWAIQMKFPFPIELRTNISPEYLYFISKDVNDLDYIWWRPLSPEYHGKRLREIEFTVWDGNDKVERRSDLGETKIIVMFKEEVD
jgi:hypothetical protein